MDAKAAEDPEREKLYGPKKEEGQKPSKLRNQLQKKVWEWQQHHKAGTYIDKILSKYKVIPFALREDSQKSPIPLKPAIKTTKKAPTTAAAPPLPQVTFAPSASKDNDDISVLETPDTNTEQSKQQQQQQRKTMTPTTPQRKNPLGLVVPDDAGMF